MGMMAICESFMMIGRDWEGFTENEGSDDSDGIYLHPSTKREGVVRA